MTLGDYLKIRYNYKVELIVTVCIVISYIGWIAAQIKALGILFNYISANYISTELGMILGASAVLIYTLAGGMLSVAILDFAQMFVMLIGLSLAAFFISNQIDGGSIEVIKHAYHNQKFNLAPDNFNLTNTIALFASFLTMALGSLPQQDVYQRVTSAKTQKIALYGTIFGAGLYFIFSFVPAFIAYSAVSFFPEITQNLIKTPEKIIPAIIEAKTNIFIQIIFYGAVLSAILSTASATLLAPSVAFSENILKHFIPKISDKTSLLTMRITAFILSLVVLFIALKSNASLYEMVSNAYKVTLAGACVPLLSAMLIKKSSANSALFSSICGLLSWITFEIFPITNVPAQLIAFNISLSSLFIYIYLEQIHLARISKKLLHLTKTNNQYIENSNQINKP